MNSLDQTNVITFVKEYLTSIGVSEDAVEAYFETHHFDNALVIKLAAVCLMPKNKPRGSKSNQTHIHVTGMPRYFFYPSAELHAITASTPDTRFHTQVSLANIGSLRRPALKFSDLDLRNTYTLTKIAVRQSQDTQVQISKIKGDDPLFIDLRSELHLNDLLVFLSSNDNQHRLTVGIPVEYYSGIGLEVEGTKVFFNLGHQSTLSVKRALRDLESAYSNHDLISDLDRVDDSIYQQQVYLTPPSSTVVEPLPKSERTSIQGDKPKRNAARGKEAIRDGNFQCAIDPSHVTFTTRNGDPYIEAHHLIPISKSPVI